MGCIGEDSKGFTLIELLIVVAFIGILSVIAMAQYTAYRQKGFNTAAYSDLKNGRTFLDAYFADHQRYPY
jgi:type IV pilus assembly protein PilA